MFKRNGIRNILKNEIRHLFYIKKSIIFSAVAGILIVIAGWIFFEGPCRLSIFFTIPGGGFTVVLYYLTWMILFAAGGGELAAYFHMFRYGDSTHYLYHIATYLCMFLWYPLFFTLFSQLLSLIVIITALVLSILNLKIMLKESLLLSVICLIRTSILFLFSYINLAFLIIN